MLRKICSAALSCQNITKPDAPTSFRDAYVIRPSLAAYIRSVNKPQMTEKSLL